MEPRSHKRSRCDSESEEPIINEHLPKKSKYGVDFSEFEMSYKLTDDDGFTSLQLLLLSGSIEECISEIEKIKLRDVEEQRKIINRQTELGFTILHFAVMIENIEIIKLLLSSDIIDVNCRSMEEITPLNLATALQNIEIIKLLVEKNACAITTPTKTMSPIFMAITLQNIDIITLFIEKGYISKFYEYYKVNTCCNEFDCTCPFTFSIDIDNPIIHQLLLNEYDAEKLKFISYEIGTSLCQAIYKQNIDLIKKILDIGGGKELIDYTEDGYCKPSLLCAIDAKNDEIFDLLMTYKPDLTLEWGENALELAIKEDYQHGYDILSKDQELLNIVDYYGKTALHRAVLGNDIKTVTMLCNSGINKDIRDDTNKTAFDYATDMKNTELMDLVEVFEPK